MGGGAKEKYLVSLHEYILCYARSINDINPIFIPLEKNSIKKYYIKKDDHYNTRGPYRTHPLEATKSMGERKNLVFPIKAPNGEDILPIRQWLWSKERVEEALKNKELEFYKDKDGNYTVHSKQYLKDEDGKMRESKAFSIIDDVFTQHGTNEIINIFGNAQIFPFPKPTGLIKKLVNIGLEDNHDDIVLDLFSGSATTGHTLLELNKKDGFKRKFICVQMADPTDKKSDAFKAGYKTIADIGKDRVRKVIGQFKEETNTKLDFKYKEQDLGFKVFKLIESNFKQWRQKEITNVNQLEDSIGLFIDPVKKGSTAHSMVYELLLKSGKNLNSKIEQIRNFFIINENELVLMLEEANQTIINEIIVLNPQKVIALDKLFEGNDQLKTNTVLQMKDAKIEFKTI